MRLDLNIAQLRNSLALWRDTLVLCAPAAECSHEMRAGQVKMLRDLSATLGGWLDLLRICSVGAADEAALAQTLAEIRGCKAWADESLAAVDLMRDVNSVGRGRW